MDNIVMVFMFQIIVCVLFFVFLYYSVKKSAELKREIEALKADATAKKRRGG